MVAVTMPSPLRGSGSGAVVGDTTLRFVRVRRRSAAARSAVAVPDRRTSLVSGARHEHAPVGLRAGRACSSAWSRWVVGGEGQRVRPPPVMPPSVPAGVASRRAQEQVDVLRARDRASRRSSPQTSFSSSIVTARLVHDAVVDAVELVVEPAVQRVDPHGAARLERVARGRRAAATACAGRCWPSARPTTAHVVHADVVVLEAVGGEDGGLDLARVLVVVAVAPERVDVAVRVAVAGVDVGVVGDGVVDRRAERLAVRQVDARRVVVPPRS